MDAVLNRPITNVSEVEEVLEFWKLCVLNPAHMSMVLTALKLPAVFSHILVLEGNYTTKVP